MRIEQYVTVKWSVGLHIRPATEIVQALKHFSCKVIFQKDDERCDANSIMRLITLEAATGDRIKIVAEGEDAEKAVVELIRIFEKGDALYGSLERWDATGKGGEIF